MTYAERQTLLVHRVLQSTLSEWLSRKTDPNKAVIQRKERREWSHMQWALSHCTVNLHDVFQLSFCFVLYALTLAPCHWALVYIFVAAISKEKQQSHMKSSVQWRGRRRTLVVWMANRKETGTILTKQRGTLEPKYSWNIKVLSLEFHESILRTAVLFHLPRNITILLIASNLLFFCSSRSAALHSTAVHQLQPAGGI